MFLDGALSNTKGQATVRFPIPRITSLIGVTVQQQFAVFDKKANRLGLTFSGYGVLTIGF